MIGEAAQVRKDGKRWRRQEVSSMSSVQCHLRTWRVMLWVLASLLALVDGSVAGRDREESTPAGLTSQERMAWHPAHHPEPQEEDEETDDHTSWDGLFESPSFLEEAEDHQRRWERSPPDPASQRSRKAFKNRGRKGEGRKGRRGKGKANTDCHMERKEMRVRDLGFGFDSDEIVVFKYCVGTCTSARKNYDLALKKLMENGSISSHNVSSHPCCRPTRYETVSFMDAKTSWKTIERLSAANCSCVG